jgi:hypothetical protein
MVSSTMSRIDVQGTLVSLGSGAVKALATNTGCGQTSHQQSAKVTSESAEIYDLNFASEIAEFDDSWMALILHLCSNDPS